MLTSIRQRLRQVVQKTLQDNGIDSNHAFYHPCTERLYSLCKSFLKVNFLKNFSGHFLQPTNTDVYCFFTAQLMPRLVINFFFFQDLRSSHGLNDEMKRLASSNVQQVQTLPRFQLCGNVWVS